MKLGIISALQEEQEGLVEAMQGTQKVHHAMRDFWCGRMGQTDAVCVLSRIGKVAAAMTATTLIERFGVTHIVFTGVAGSAQPGVKVGDIVVAESLAQYDMDASPLFPRFEVPLTGLAYFASDTRLSGSVARAAQEFVDLDLETAIAGLERQDFGLKAPRVHRGLVASGDQFITDRHRLAAIADALPGLLAVEMEGAAVAQVCFEFGLPFAVVRTISDNANEDAAIDFMRFVKSVAAIYSRHIVTRMAGM
jgi:adenosylhomocysteine nucleosidase